ncbi:DUF927 domain-containing protein [Zobellella taiwanensis]
MKYKSNDQGLFYLADNKYQRIGGPIRVLARTRLPGRRHGHGALLEWQNHDGELLREVVYARDLNGDHSRQIRDMLVDSGYALAPVQASWSRLQYYLLTEMTQANPAMVVNRTGWHGNVFAAGSWTAGEADEPYYYVGQLSQHLLLSESGNLMDWQQHVGALCRGNPLSVFSVGVALAAPLLASSGIENGAYHIAGPSSGGKSTILGVACSVYGPPQFMRTWASTANGLAAVSSQHSDLLLPLDEIGMVRPEDADLAIYQLMNGVGKLRADISGELVTPAQWRTLILSTGEIWISEVLEQIGKKLKAGQQTRLVEIPIFGNFGAFDQLHGRYSAREFADELKSACKKYYGTLIREWATVLAGRGDELGDYISSEVERISSLWTSDNMASQVHRVVRRFALVAAALSLASKHSLVPWDEEESMLSVRRVLEAWIVNRGHTFNQEEYRVLQKLHQLIVDPKGRVARNPELFKKGQLAFAREVDGEVQWLFPKENLLKYLCLPTRYMRELEPLLQKGFFETNERSRGTLRLMIGNRYERFFAFWPKRVHRYMQSISDDLSQFPTCPTRDTEVQNHE